MDPAGLLHSLDAEQRQAVTSTAQPLAIVAAAGSGKTTVLTRRIAYRVASGTADAKHVLALTFTREAAAELRRRIRRLDLREPIEAGTFHAVALRLLRDRALARNQAAPVVAFDKLRLIRDTLADLRCPARPARRDRRSGLGVGQAGAAGALRQGQPGRQAAGGNTGRAIRRGARRLHRPQAPPWGRGLRRSPRGDAGGDA
ncbi:MAG: UvrD-helicase domain-containing protein [Ilumatobacteraceae bacterium]